MMKPRTMTVRTEAMARGVFKLVGFDEGGVRGSAEHRPLVCLLHPEGKLAIWGSDQHRSNIDRVIAAGPYCTVGCEYQASGDDQARNYGHTHWVQQTFDLKVLP